MSEQPGTDPATAPGARPHAQPATRRRLLALLPAVVALAVAVLFPLGANSNQGDMSIAVFVLIYMASVSAWNIFSGYSGYLALGHAVFFGSGAYAIALMARDWHVPAGWSTVALLPLCGVVAGLIAIPVGLVALRTRRHTFVVVTIAIFFIFQTLATNLAFTGGTGGIQLPYLSWLVSVYNERFYYIALVLVVLTVALSWAVRRSRFGLQLMAIRDDEDRARGMGVRTLRVKLSAFVLSAIPVGIAGGIYAYFLGSIYPAGSGSAFDPLFDIALALMGFLGGIGTISGPLLGALVLEALQEKLTQTFSTDGLYLIIYGALFLVVILLMPRGIVPTVAGRLRQWREQRSGRTPEPAAGVGVAGVAR
jgi:branched-chain amino acid transport system permease protein